MKFETPPFFGKGSFQWDALGYQLSGPAPSGLLDNNALRSTNPWMRLAAVLERAKIGDFSTLPVLIGCLREADDWVLAKACAELMGDAGSPSFLREVERQFHADLFEDDVPLLQIKLASTFALSGLLWTIPVVLGVYERVADERQAVVIPLHLSQVLEPRFILFSSRDSNVTLAEYRTAVMETYDRLVRQYRREDTPLRYGQLFSVQSLASGLYERLRTADTLEVYIVRDRHRFEATTGMDCRVFFENGRLNTLAATAIVEEFLESPEVAKYEDGVRYFYGHRIPD